MLEQSSTTPRGRSLAVKPNVVDVTAGVAVCLDEAAVSARPDVARATATAVATAALAITVQRRAVIQRRYTGGSAAVPDMSIVSGVSMSTSR
jgi:hypothetical protein